LAAHAAKPSAPERQTEAKPISANRDDRSRSAAFDPVLAASVTVDAFDF
jgi:hypothetical protein